jgi:hypothetical protein
MWTKKKKRVKADQAGDSFADQKSTYQLTTEIVADPVEVDPSKHIEEAEEQLEMRNQILELFPKEQIARMVSELQAGTMPKELEGFPMEGITIKDLAELFQGVLENI